MNDAQKQRYSRHRGLLTHVEESRDRRNERLRQHRIQSKLSSIMLLRGLHVQPDEYQIINNNNNNNNNNNTTNDTIISDGLNGGLLPPLDDIPSVLSTSITNSILSILSNDIEKRIQLIQNTLNVIKVDISQSNIKGAIERLRYLLSFPFNSILLQSQNNDQQSGDAADSFEAMVINMVSCDDYLLHFIFHCLADPASSSTTASSSSVDETIPWEACWCVTNLSASSNPTIISKVVGIAPYLIQYLSCNNISLQEQSTWTLGNLAKESTDIRDTLCAQGIIPPLLKIFNNLNLKNSSFIITCCFTIHTLLFPGKQQSPKFQHHGGGGESSQPSSSSSYIPVLELMLTNQLLEGIKRLLSSPLDQDTKKELLWLVCDLSTLSPIYPYFDPIYIQMVEGSDTFYHTTILGQKQQQQQQLLQSQSQLQEKEKEFGLNILYTIRTFGFLFSNEKYAHHLLNRMESKITLKMIEFLFRIISFTKSNQILKETIYLLSNITSIDYRTLQNLPKDSSFSRLFISFGSIPLLFQRYFQYNPSIQHQLLYLFNNLYCEKVFDLIVNTHLQPALEDISKFITLENLPLEFRQLFINKS